MSDMIDRLATARRRFAAARDRVEAARAPPNDIKWTAREAMACAYCWAEFISPEGRGDSPEAYWQSIAEGARNDCRRVANGLWLLAVARGDAVAVTSPHMFTAAERAAIGAEVGIKAPSRIWKIIMAVRNGAARRSAPPCDRAASAAAPKPGA